MEIKRKAEKAIREKVDADENLKAKYAAAWTELEALCKEKTELLLQLANADTNGTFDRDQVLEVAAYLNIPQFAGRILRPKQEAEADIVKNVADDLTLIWAGNTVNARPTGANVALNYIQGYVQQESIMRRTQEDQNYSAALNAYIQQYQMQIQQQQNAVTGRLGAPQQDINNV